MELVLFFFFIFCVLWIAFYVADQVIKGTFFGALVLFCFTISFWVSLSKGRDGMRKQGKLKDWYTNHHSMIREKKALATPKSVFKGKLSALLLLTSHAKILVLKSWAFGWSAFITSSSNQINIQVYNNDPGQILLPNSINMPKMWISNIPHPSTLTHLSYISFVPIYFL